MGKPEGAIENYLIRQMKAADALIFKFVSPSFAGVPDRIVIAKGRVVFVEVKAPGQKTRPLQDAVIARMRAHGADVRIIDTKPMVDDLRKEIESWTQPCP